MRAVVDRGLFAESFKLCSQFAGATPHRSELGCVLFDASPDGCELSATDLEVGVRVKTRGVQVLEPGRVLLPRDAVGAALSLCGDESMEFSGDDKGPLTVKHERVEYSFLTQDHGSFPEVAGHVDGVIHEIPASDLIGLIKLSRFCVEKERVSGISGVMIGSGHGEMVMVGTDGRRVAVASKRGVSVTEGTVTVPESASGDKITNRGVVHRRALERMLGCLHDNLEQVAKLTIGRSLALLDLDDIVMTARLSEGKFPDYRRALGMVRGVDFIANLSLDVGAFREAVGLAASMVDEIESKALDFSIGRGELRISSGGTTYGRGVVSMPIDHAGSETTVRIDPKYVLQAIDVIGDGRVSFDVINEKSPVLVTVDGLGFTYVMMPMVRM